MKILKLLFIFFFILSMNTVFSEQSLQTAKPLWEVRLFGGVASIPHYNGSDETSVYAVPFPTVLYRGEIVQADRTGIRAIFFERGPFLSELSFSGSPPVNEDNKARTGMIELGPILETGPSLKYYFTDKSSNSLVFIDLSIRKVLEADLDNLFRIQEQGIHGGIKLAYKYNPLYEIANYSIGINGGVDFGNKDYLGFYYNVSKQFETESRPEYTVESGYAGLYLSTYFHKNINDKFKIVLYGRITDINNAVFQDSPLVKKNMSYLAGIAVIWKITESKKTIKTSCFYN